MNKKLKKLKIYVVDIDPTVLGPIRDRFKDSLYNIEFICSDIRRFATTFPTVEAYVSPGNAFGLMDGGYDDALSRIVGMETVLNLRKTIVELFGGEQAPGTCLMIPFNDKYLLHSPTMRRPSAIKDPTVVYYCMRSVIRMCLNHNIQSVVVPAFGGCTGKLNPSVIADMMFFALESLQHAYNATGSYTWNNIFRFEENLSCESEQSPIYNINIDDTAEKYEPLAKSAVDIHKESVEEFKLRVFGGM